jgi:hypothetical protein
MKNKVKNVVIAILSLIVFFFVIVPWLSGNNDRQSANRQTVSLATAEPISTVLYRSEPKATPYRIKLLPVSTAVHTLYIPEPTDTIEDKQSVTVYITKTGQKYHKSGCQYLRQSRIPIDLDDAVAEGYTPCSKCKPPK